MKKLIFVNLFPFAIVLLIIHYLTHIDNVNKIIFSNQKKVLQSTSDYYYIANFADNPYFEKSFLLDEDTSKPTIYLLGSSELTSESEAIPYKFITNNFPAKIKAIGHAGNQSFSMYCQLLANEDRLDNTKIIFILSPGWFESKASKGTSSEIFLEYNSENFLKKILEKDNKFSHFAGMRIAQLYSEFNAPNLPLKLINFKYRASKSLLHKALYAPLIYFDNFLMKEKEKLVKTIENNTEIIPITYNDATNANSNFNWDSILALSRIAVLNNATNNNIGVSNDYYATYLNINSGKIQPLDNRFIKELEDFKMLMQLIRTKNIDAFFIIQPLNTLYYSNLATVNPAIDEVRKELKGNNNQRSYDFIDFFVTDTAQYDRGLLVDLMHFSDYGWYKVNQRIINHYNLNNEK